MKITLRLVVSKLIPTFALAAKNAPAKGPTVHSSTVVPGTLSKWCQLRIGKACTASHFRMLRPRHPLRNVTWFQQRGSVWLWLSEPLVLLCGPNAAVRARSHVRIAQSPADHLDFQPAKVREALPKRSPRQNLS